jgi:hypothetical protein
VNVVPLDYPAIERLPITFSDDNPLRTMCEGGEKQSCHDKEFRAPTRQYDRHVFPADVICPD